MEKLKLFLKNFLTRNFLMYALIGAVNTFNTAVFSKLLAEFFNCFTSSAAGAFLEHISGYLGFFFSLSLGYVYNAKFNFKHKLSFSEYIKFMMSYIPNFFIYAIISSVALSILHWDPFAATIVAALAGVPVTYALMYYFTFQQRKNHQKRELLKSLKEKREARKNQEK